MHAKRIGQAHCPGNACALIKAAKGDCARYDSRLMSVSAHTHACMHAHIFTAILAHVHKFSHSLTHTSKINMMHEYMHACMHARTHAHAPTIPDIPKPTHVPQQVMLPLPLGRTRPNVPHLTLGAAPEGGALPSTAAAAAAAGVAAAAWCAAGWRQIASAMAGRRGSIMYLWCRGGSSCWAGTCVRVACDANGVDVATACTKVKQHAWRARHGTCVQARHHTGAHMNSDAHACRPVAQRVW